MTSDASILNNTTPYTGSSNVMIGNGKLLSITHTGDAILSTPTKNFQLKKILHIPSLKANLLSIAKFTKDNNCFF